MFEKFNVNKNKIYLVDMSQDIHSMREKLLTVDSKTLKDYMDFLGYSHERREDVAEILWYNCLDNCDQKYVAKILQPLCKYHEFVQDQITNEKIKNPLESLFNMEEEIFEEVSPLPITPTEKMDAAIQRRIDIEIAAEYGIPLDYIK